MTSNDDIFDFLEAKPEENTPPQPPITAGPIVIKKDLLDPCVSEIDEAHDEELILDMGNGAMTKLTYQIPAKPTAEHELATWEMLENVERRAWSNNSVGLKTGFNSFDKAFDGGWKPGFYVIAGDSNLGKSAMLTQINWKILENNDKVYLMDFSLDDPMPDKVGRMVASWNRVIINAVKSPMQYSHLPLMLVRRKEGINRLKKAVNKYRPYDSNFSSFIEDIEEEVQRMKIILEKTDPEIQLVVAIDSFHDLAIKAKGMLTETQKYNEIAQWAADLAIKYDVVLIVTAELKKVEGIRRPQLGDLRESIKIRYEAKAILMVYNDVHYKGENADVFFQRKNSPEKQPVFEVQIAKNKIHSFKGRFFYYFYPEMAYMEEVDDNTAKTFANSVT